MPEPKDLPSLAHGYNLYIDLLKQCLYFFKAEFLESSEIKDVLDINEFWFRPDNKFIMAKADVLYASIKQNGMFLPFIISPDRFIVEGQHRLDALHKNNDTTKYLSIIVKDRLTPKALKFGKPIVPPIRVVVPEEALGGNLLRLIKKVDTDIWLVDSQTVLMHMLVDFGTYLKDYTWDNKDTLIGHPLINNEEIFNAVIREK